jgi:hypothetical protein
MAGTFTHFMVCDAAKANRKALPPDLRKLLNNHAEFLFLGAVSPDLPYLSFKNGNVNWANVMHYETTNAIAVNAHEVLKKAWGSRSIREEIQLVWLLGFVSHLVTDATIHPIVQAIVGSYDEHKEEHRICEMTQDSLIYFEIKKMEIRYSEFSSILKFCRESPHIDALVEFWINQTVKAFSAKNEEPDPGLWMETYSEAIDVAEGGSSIVALFRHIGTIREYTYNTREEIVSNHPDRLRQFYMEMKLPDGGTGSFREAAFNRAVANVTAAWNALYAGLTGNVTVAGVVRNWNLDTGEDMNSNPRTVSYWEKV